MLEVRLRPSGNPPGLLPSAEPTAVCHPQQLAGSASLAEPEPLIKSAKSILCSVMHGNDTERPHVWQVMHLAERLAHLGQQRQALVTGTPLPPLEAALGLIQQRLQLLEASLKQAEVKTTDTRRQQSDGASFRSESHSFAKHMC